MSNNNAQRSILAEFLKEIPTTNGLWYRIAVLNSDIVNEDLNMCLPHFGSIFGLTEDAIAVVLIEMGLLRLRIKSKKENKKKRP